MEHQHQLRTLAQRDNGYIGYCAGCNAFNVAYKNSLFILSETEYNCYQAIMSDRTAMQPFYTTHQKEWLMKTPMPNYFLVFSDAEIDELVQMMEEALVMREVDQILHTSHRLG